MNRRHFFMAAGAAATAFGANERVNLALIGGRNRGSQIAEGVIKAGGRIKTFCDLDPAILDKAGADIEKWQGARPGYEKQFQRVLEDKDIDAVMIATPDHWHARMGLLAMARRARTCTWRSLSARRSMKARSFAMRHASTTAWCRSERSAAADRTYRSAAEYVAAGQDRQGAAE